MQGIDTSTLLPEGTKVQVKNKRGVVHKAVWAKDQFRQPICLHTIEFKTVSKREFDVTTGKMITAWVPLEKPIVEEVNYSFIYTY